MPPLVSVVIPCFNAGPMLRPALRSVLDQTYPEIEIIFVDNNSTDGSLERAREFLTEAPRLATVTGCAMQGVNRARNWGYRLARGDFIQWLDADDELHPDKIARQVEALKRDAASDIAYGDWTRRRHEAARMRSDQPVALGQGDDQLLRTLAGVWYPPHLYLVRRAAAQRLQDAEAWFPSRPVATDVEYSAVAALLGLRFCHVAGAHVTYNVWSPAQISGGTPYPARVASLKSIFERLQSFVAAGRAPVPLAQRHKTLLYQNWDVWRMAPGSVEIVKLAGRRYRLRHGASRHEIAVRPREAAIARALMAQGAALTSCHHALMLAETVPETEGDHAAIVETLARFQRESLLERMVVAPEGTRSA